MAGLTFSVGAPSASHDASQFDSVLAGRYVFMAVAVLCVFATGRVWMLVALLAALSAVGFWDYFVYARAQLTTSGHLFAAVAAAVAAVIIALSAARKSTEV
jgi:hypothetical protein